MPYESDYLDRLVEHLRSRRGPTSAGSTDEQKITPCDLSSEALGLALGLDPDLASQLSPETLVSFLQLWPLQQDTMKALAEEMDIEAQTDQATGREQEATLRRGQAKVMRSLLRVGRDDRARGRALLTRNRAAGGRRYRRRHPRD